MRVTCRKSARVLPFSHHRLLAWGWLDTYFQLLLHKREKSCWCWPGNAKPAFIRFGTASVLLVIDVVKYCRPNMTTVVFRQDHQFCHRRRPILLVLTQLELSLKEPIFYSFQQSKPSRAIIDKYFIRSTALYCCYCTLHWSAVLSIFCILLERLTQPRLTLNQEYPSYLLDIRQ